MKVYVLTTDSCTEMGGTEVGARVYGKREDAEQVLKNMYESESKENWYNKQEYVAGDYFDFWVDGYYERAHYHAYIEEQEIL